MHVCFLFHREFPQQFATVTNEYPRLLADHGHKVSVIAASNDSKQVQHESVNNIDIHRIPTSDLGKKSLAPTRFAYRGLQRLAQLSRNDLATNTEAVDVLHMTAFPDLGAVLRPVPWLASPPTVVDMLGPGTSSQLAYRVSTVALQIQAALADTVITQNPLMAKYFLGDRTVNTSIVPIGVDFERFQPVTDRTDTQRSKSDRNNNSRHEIRQEYNISTDDIVFGYLGNCNTVRQLDVLIDAISYISKTNTHAKLMIVGDGDDRDRLERRTAHNGTTNAVTFTGAVPHADVPVYCHAFDVGISHIPDSRPFNVQSPLKTIEYLASGLPVLATATPGNRRIVTNDVNGLLCQDTDAAMYARLMENLINNSQKRERLGANARESVREYNYHNVIENYLLPVYEQVIANHG